MAPQAVDVAAGLNIAAFSVGIALGASLGGLVVEDIGLRHTPWIGALVVMGAFGLTVVAGRMDRRDGVTANAEGIAVAAH